MKTYSINGWINLSGKSPVINNVSTTQVDLDAIITKNKKIKVYLTPDGCQTNIEKKYYKEYYSKNGFTHMKVLELIQKTYWKACSEIWDDDEDNFSHLALHTFNFDVESSKVIPDTDS